MPALTQRTKLLALLAVLLVPLAVVAADKLTQRLARARKFADLPALSALVVDSQALVDALQAERAVAAGAPPAESASAAKPASGQTGRAAEQLRELLAEFDDGRYGEGFVAPAERALKDLSLLEQKRAGKGGGAIQPGAELMREYTRIIDMLLSQAGLVSGVVGRPAVVKTIDTYVSLARLKEKAELERLVLVASLGGGSPESQTLPDFTKLLAAQDMYTEAFLQFATPEQRALFARAEEVGEVKRLRKVLLTSPDQLRFAAAPKLWWEAQTERLGALEAVEAHMATELSAMVGRAEGRAQIVTPVEVATALAALGAAVGLILLLLRGEGRSVGVAVETSARETRRRVLQLEEQLIELRSQNEDAQRDRDVGEMRVRLLERLLGQLRTKLTDLEERGTPDERRSAVAGLRQAGERGAAAEVRKLAALDAEHESTKLEEPGDEPAQAAEDADVEGRPAEAAEGKGRRSFAKHS